MTTLLFSSRDDPVELWLPALQAELPEVEIRVDPDIGDPAEIDYALTYFAPHGLLASLPNLKLIHSIAAGIDHLIADPDLPRHLPIVRMVDDNLRNMMSEYAVYAVLHFHRDMQRYRQCQGRADWSRGWPDYTPDTAVGVLGLGAIGRDVAAKLGVFGFDVHGWSSTAKTIEGVVCHHGPAGLRAMASAVKYLVCVLPLTEQTQGIIDAALIRAMPAGGVIVSIGRGGHVVDDDLLAALSDDHLAGAFLDVFNEEPLPPSHPYWRHAKVVMTPHIAGELVPRSCAAEVARNIRRFEAGEPLPTRLDLDKGY